MSKVIGKWPHQNSIKIEWNLTKRCNYDCSYCPASIHDNSSKPVDIEILKGTIDKLVAIGKPIRLSFTGGEPTVHPKFSELLHYARDKGINWISVTTNGTRTADWYMVQPVDQYVFSIHFEYDWLRVVNTIKEVSLCRNIQLLAQIMAHHNKMDDVRTAHSMLSSSIVPTTIRRIRWTEGDHDLFDDMRYHPDDLNWVTHHIATVKPNVLIDGKEYHANDVIKLHLNKYKDWTCFAGIESLMINWDGDVHRATCRVGGSLGNMYENTFKIPDAPIICNRNHCTCASDIPLTKYTQESLL